MHLLSNILQYQLK